MWKPTSAAIVLSFAFLVGCGGEPSNEASCTGKCDSLGVYELDPTVGYESRLEMVALLQARYPLPVNFPDPLDGIVIQTEWQHDSLRGIDPDSGEFGGWWPNLNWALTVWPFVALQDGLGEFDDVHVVIPEDWRFDLPPDVASDMGAYFLHRAHLSERLASGAAGLQERRALAAQAQDLMWTYHTSAIRRTLSLNESELALLPDGEREFARAWGATWVELLAAANFPTDAATVEFVQGSAIPQRIVEPADYYFFGSDLPRNARTFIRALAVLDAFEHEFGHPVRSLFTRLEDKNRAQAFLYSFIMNGVSLAQLWELNGSQSELD